MQVVFERVVSKVVLVQVKESACKNLRPSEKRHRAEPWLVRICLGLIRLAFDIYKIIWSWNFYVWYLRELAFIWRWFYAHGICDLGETNGWVDIGQEVPAQTCFWPKVFVIIAIWNEFMISSWFQLQCLKYSFMFLILICHVVKMIC